MMVGLAGRWGLARGGRGGAGAAVFCAPKRVVPCAVRGREVSDKG